MALGMAFVKLRSPTCSSFGSWVRGVIEMRLDASACGRMGTGEWEGRAGMNIYTCSAAALDAL